MGSDRVIVCVYCCSHCRVELWYLRSVYKLGFPQEQRLEVKVCFHETLDKSYVLMPNNGRRGRGERGHQVPSLLYLSKHSLLALRHFELRVRAKQFDASSQLQRKSPLNNQLCYSFPGCLRRMRIQKQQLRCIQCH